MGGDNIGRCERKVRWNVCLILNGYREGELFGLNIQIFTKFAAKFYKHVVVQAFSLSLCH